MATASLTATPTTLDAGISASITVKNTGNNYVTVTNGPERIGIRPSRDVTLVVNGLVQAFVPTEQGGSGTISYDVAGTFASTIGTKAVSAVQQLIAASTGTAVLAAGSKAVADTAITASSVIRLSYKAIGGTPGAVYISAKTPGTGFTIASTSGTDTSTVAYEVVSY